MTDWEERRRLMAEATVATPAKLRKRLNEAKSVLKRVYAERFRKPTLDVAKRRLNSSDGKLFLQWSNGSTTVGNVALYERVEA